MAVKLNIKPKTKNQPPAKAHAQQEMAALRKGKAPTAVMREEKAEYGMKSGGMVKGKKPC